MADLLDRVLREIRERKDRTRAALDETRRLEAALAGVASKPALRASPRLV